MTTGLEVSPVTNWAQRLRNRLFTQFRGTNFEQIADIIAEQAQPLEDAWQQLFSIASIDVSVGVQLQTLGVLVGQPYNGEDDATYRLRLKARIKANLSSGTATDLYGVFLAMFGLTGTGYAQIVTSPSAPAALEFISLRPLYGAESTVLFELLVIAKLAGVRLVLEWPSSDDAGSFAFDAEGAGFGGLVSVAPFPDAGTAYPDFGGAFASSLSS